MNIVSIIVGIIVGIVVFLFGQFVGVPQPLLGIIALLAFVLVAFYGRFNSPQL